MYRLTVWRKGCGKARLGVCDWSLCTDSHFFQCDCKFKNMLLYQWVPGMISVWNFLIFKSFCPVFKRAPYAQRASEKRKRKNRRKNKNGRKNNVIMIFIYKNYLHNSIKSELNKCMGPNQTLSRCNQDHKYRRHLLWVVCILYTSCSFVLINNNYIVICIQKGPNKTLSRCNEDYQYRTIRRHLMQKILSCSCSFAFKLQYLFDWRP